MSSRSWSAVRASASRDAGAQLLLEHRQHAVAGPHPGVRRVGVVGVGPEVDALDLAGGDGVVARDVEQRPAVAVERPPHAGQGPAAGAAGEAEQHGLGLVVAGVPEQHQLGPEVVGHLVEHRVAGLARCCLGARARRPRRARARPRSRRRPSPPSARRPGPRGRPNPPAGRGRRSPRPPGRAGRAPRRRRRRAGPASRRRPSRRPARPARRSRWCPHGQGGELTAYAAAYGGDGGVEAHRLTRVRERPSPRARTARPSTGGSRAAPRPR